MAADQVEGVVGGAVADACPAGGPEAQLITWQKSGPARAT